MVLLAAHVLIGFVTLAGDQNDVARTGQCYRSPNRFVPIGDGQISVRGFEARLHLFDDRIGILHSGIVRSENSHVAVIHGDLCHFGAFGPVPIPAASDNYVDVLASLSDFVDGPEYVLEGVWCMGGSRR